MPTKKEQTIIRIILIAFVSLALFAVAGPVNALPPRSTPAPPGDRSDDDDDGSVPIGAWIELQAGATLATWSHIEWQDSDGNWQPVEGWAGTLENGSRRWWVGAKDFGTGPFRWVVSAGSGGSVVGMSAPFMLPGGANETVSVTTQ